MNVKNSKVMHVTKAPDEKITFKVVDANPEEVYNSNT